MDNDSPDSRASLFRSGAGWSLPLSRLRWVVLGGAILIYGLWGSPTPDRLGAVEALVGGLLLLAIGAQGAWTAFSSRFTVSWQIVALALFVYGVTIPLIAALVYGNSIHSILRDIVPFLFLLLPLFMGPYYHQSRPLNEDRAIAFGITAAVSAAGWLFAFRVIWPAFTTGQIISDPAHLLLRDPDYLANAPTVLFACVALIGYAGTMIYRHFGMLAFMRALALLALALIPLATMAGLMQRAYFGYTGLAAVLLLLAALVRRPARALPLLVMALAAMILFWPYLAAVTELLMRKSEIVGVNMRWQEAAAVFDAVRYDIWSIIFGKGWGAMFPSPAVGGQSVNFTHSLLTTYLLKTGVVGLVLAVTYLFLLMRDFLVPLLFIRPVIAVALAGPVLINIFLYASFKSLGFGLLLLLFPLWANRAHMLHKKPLCSRSKRDFHNKQDSPAPYA